MPALEFEIIAKCSTSKARVSRLKLPHATVATPVFMPVGTQGTMKGVTNDQLEAVDCNLILGNTYHLVGKSTIHINPRLKLILGLKTSISIHANYDNDYLQGQELLDKIGGLHKFMNWKHALLTDSGGFQMVSLLKLANITEDGVEFQSPHDGSRMLLTPEKSISLQNSIGADIMMQLDDVVSSLTTGPRVEEAMWRSIRWLDRCIKAHQNMDNQNLFAIIQGGLNEDLRKQCVKEMVKRDLPGYAIGGLSGGEEKSKFWRMVTVSTDHLPENKPRYCMGVGYALDLVVCCALGVDMFDCVFPTRTGRFGHALTRYGSLNLKHAKYAHDMRPIDENCSCVTCKSYSRAHLHKTAGKDATAGSLLSIHNIAYQMSLMKGIRDAIKIDEFPSHVKSVISDLFHEEKDVPEWAVEALKSVGINIR